jgi:hypothetical protein
VPKENIQSKDADQRALDSDTGRGWTQMHTDPDIPSVQIRVLDAFLCVLRVSVVPLAGNGP